MGSFTSVNLDTSKCLPENNALKKLNDNDNVNLPKTNDSNITIWDSEMKRESNICENNSSEITETVLLTNRITFKRKLNSEFNLEYMYNIKIRPHQNETNSFTCDQSVDLIETDTPEIDLFQIEHNKKAFKINQTKDWINKHKIKKAKTIKKKYANNDILSSSAGGNRPRRSMRHKFRRTFIPIYEIQKIKGVEEEVIGVPNLIGTKLNLENSKKISML
jgi:hypothetical protein